MNNRVTSAYIQQYQQIQQIAAEEDSTSLIRKQRNWKHPDGRIHATRNGEQYLALTVSPYASDFENQIEDDVKPLVLLLREKNYLTTSSCQGHRWRDCLRVSLAFGDQQSRDQFVDWFKSLKIPYSTCTEIKNPSNVNSWVRRGNLLHERINNGDDSQTAKWFNVFFHRKYEQYYFCELKLWDFEDGVDPVALWNNYKIWNFKQISKSMVMDYLLAKLRDYPDYLL